MPGLATLIGATATATPTPTAPVRHAGFDWAGLWALLGGLGGAAAVVTLLLAYLPNLFIPLKITAANYQVGSDNSMAITITVKNRRNQDRSLTALTIGQPPGWVRRLRPRWWRGLVGPKLFDIGSGINSLGPILAGDSKVFDSVPLKREAGTPVADTLPSDVRILAYCGAHRPSVKRPKKI